MINNSNFIIFHRIYIPYAQKYDKPHLKSDTTITFQMLSLKLYKEMRDRNYEHEQP